MNVYIIAVLPCLTPELAVTVSGSAADAKTLKAIVLWGIISRR